MPEATAPTLMPAAPVEAAGSAALRVGFVCNEYPDAPHGGLGVVTRVLARGLQARGHRVRVIGSYTDASDEVQETDQGVQVLRLPESVGPGGWIRARYAVYRQVARWAREGEIDLVEVPDWEGWAAGWPRLPIPVVVRMHGSGVFIARASGKREPRMTRLLEGASLRRADFRCASSQFVAFSTAEAFRLQGPEARVIYNPVDEPSVSDGTPRSGAEVVFAGTLNANKGITRVLEGWPRVLARQPAARLHVFGRGTTGFRRADLAAGLSDAIRPTVTFHGQVDRTRVLEAFRRARVAVFPSLVEAFAVAPLEAMSQGCPTVFTRGGSGPELIDHEHNGLLVNPRDPVEIAEMILRVIHDGELAERLEVAGRRRSAHFALETILPANEAFYRESLRRFHAH